MAEGVLPKPVKIGKVQFFPVAAVKQWLAEGAPPGGCARSQKSRKEGIE